MRERKLVKKEKKEKKEKEEGGLYRLLEIMDKMIGDTETHRVELLLNTVAFMLEKAGGMMVVDLKRGHEIRHEYTLKTIRDSSKPLEVRLCLIVREGGDEDTKEESLH